MTLEEVLRLIRSGDAEAIDRLAEAGALDFITDDETKTALVREAAKAGKVRMLRHLFEHHHMYGTNDDEQGRTLLHYAAMSGDVETVKFAVQVLGYDPMTSDAAGETALETARRACNKEAYNWLKAQQGFGAEDCYRNPVMRGFHPDPSVVRVGEDYYMVNSSFVFFPGLPISHSRDLVHWEVIGHAAENLEWSGIRGLPGGYGYWAPDISYYKGKFWVVATLRRDTRPMRLQMITSASDPRGPWSQPRFLPVNGIDPSLFADDDGRRYMLINPGAILIEINDDGEMISEPEMIYLGSARIKSEGPHLLKKDGWYYLFLAEGGTGPAHRETVARARTIRGPYEACPWNPILGRVNAHCPVGRSGHGKPVSTPDGRWYMIYLCGRTVEGKTMLGRETALDPMTWTEDGWPMVNGLRGPSVLQKLPEKCGGVRVNREWISPRNNPTAFASWEGESALTMKCGGDPAAIPPCSVLVRRQAEANFRETVALDVQNCEEDSVAGITGYYDERSFFLFGMNRSGEILLIEQEGGERRKKLLADTGALCAVLRVEGRGFTRALQRKVGERFETLHTFTAGYLCDEGVKGGKRFTGATIGLAAVGAGTARFSDYADEMWE